MHSPSFTGDGNNKCGGDVLVDVAALITEGRLPGRSSAISTKGFYEGPHCSLNKKSESHICNLSDDLCLKYDLFRDEVLRLWKNKIPLCIEVLLTCGCADDDILAKSEATDHGLLLEQWYFSIVHKSCVGTSQFQIRQLANAIRSQLYFSQITAWLIPQDNLSDPKLTGKNVHYRLAIPGETFQSAHFLTKANEHKFPTTDIGNNLILNASCFSLPRMESMPKLMCVRCCGAKVKLEGNFQKLSEVNRNNLLDDRMHTVCKLKGKHHCEDIEEFENTSNDQNSGKCKRLRNNANSVDLSVFYCEPSTSSGLSKNKFSTNVDLSYTSVTACHLQNLKLSDNSPTKDDNNSASKNIDLSKFINWKKDGKDNKPCHRNDLTKTQDKSQILLDAIERSGQQKVRERRDNSCDDKCVQNQVVRANMSECDNEYCDMSDSDNFSCKDKKRFDIYVDKTCDNPIPSNNKNWIKMKDISNLAHKRRSSTVRQKIAFDNHPSDGSSSKQCDNEKQYECRKAGSKEVATYAMVIPTASEQAKFRKHFDNATSMVFHSRTGLPLTSSPAPVRRGTTCFDYDSTLNSVSAIKSAFFSSSFSTDDESESDGSLVSPCSPDTYIIPNKVVAEVTQRRKARSANLLGSFEESVLKGRLEPVSTVQGFTAELGASGSFVPKHLVVPVTVFFYTLGDNDKVSSPYLGHINLGKKGYNVPRVGTVQVTLFNPLGTVVKMFVIMYDLSDMPPNSQTFIRQRTLYMPTNCKDKNIEWGPKWLRYLIHLRFMSSKSGKIYLHSDIRMIIFCKSDLDTATAHSIDMSYELRSFTHMPSNPKFSPTK